MNLRKITATAAALMMLSCIFPGTVNADGAVYRDISFADSGTGSDEPVKGVDISSVIALEKSGVVFKDRNGKPKDIFLTLKEAGVNYIRVRVWNSPQTSDGRTYGGGANDIDTAVKIAERCSKYGLKMLIDFHYSDFWADPGKQKAPKAWQTFSVDRKCSAVEEYTGECLKKIGATGAEIGMVQIGNETVSGLCGETDWKNICRIMNAGSKAVRSYDRSILVAVHFTNPEKSGNYSRLAGYLSSNSVDYDVFATSYYPYWHGTVQNLSAVLKDISSRYGKYVMVAETSWVNTFEDTDRFANTISDRASLGNYVSYDVSVQGQIDSVTNVFQAVADSGSKGLGVFYWEPAWITVGNEYSSNMALWERDGSGWATKASAEYDAEAEKYYGGSSVDNQALFSPDGRPLDSLYVFSHIKGGGREAPESTNLIINPGFENGEEGWKFENTTSGEYSKFEVNAEMVRTGLKSAHWYSPEAFEYTGMYAEYTAPESGEYSFSAYIAGEKNRYKTLISVNGEHRASEEGTTTAYDRWENPEVVFKAEKGDTIGIWIEINGDKGAYGSVDDCRLIFNGKENTSAGNPGSSGDQPDIPSVPQPEIPPETPVYPGTDYEKGDINGDGVINTTDFIALTAWLLGIANTTDMSAVDMNGDGTVNIADCVLLRNRLMS